MGRYIGKNIGRFYWQILISVALYFKAVAATAGICPTHYFNRLHNSAICEVKVAGQSVAHFESTGSRYKAPL